MMKWYVFLLFSVSFLYLGCCDEIKVDLSSYRPNNKTNNVFKKYTTLSDDETKVKIKNINEDIGFFIIQIHSYDDNVTLSYNSTLLVHSYVTGTNIGLVYAYGDSSATFYIFRYIKFDRKTDIMLIITVYDALDPIPGGCNLSFGNRLAPYQLTSYTEDYILVESQPPSAVGVNCDDNKVHVDMYHLYFNQPDSQSNFKAIDKMITVDDIKLHGKRVAPGEGYFTYRRLYSSYIRTGQVFAIVATYNNRSSAYIPAVSYGCDITKFGAACVGPVVPFWKCIGAALIIFGVFICFLGHKFFRFTLFTTGFTFGVLVTYLAISFDGHFAAEEKMITSLIIGFFYGVIWVFIWWKYGVSLISVNLNFILTGFLVASVIFFAGLADIGIYRSDLNFWVTFTCIIIACLLICSPATMYGHIFSCSLLGSFAVVAAVNTYLDGHMLYIIVNIFRRATVKNFNMAVTDPPIDLNDILHFSVWIFLLALGYYVQLRFQRGNPPFPPHRNWVPSVTRMRAALSERTPLIHPDEYFENIPQYVPQTAPRTFPQTFPETYYNIYTE